MILKVVADSKERFCKEYFKFEGDTLHVFSSDTREGQGLKKFQNIQSNIADKKGDNETYRWQNPPF